MMIYNETEFLIIKNLKHIKIYFTGLAVIILAACNGPEKPPQTNNQSQPQVQQKAAPQFNADTAYDIIKKQVDFGPRVPNTKAHDACAKYLENKMRQYTSDVTVQTGEVKAYDGTRLHIKNIIGVMHPEKHRKILLCAHWDSRPWADQDSVDKKKPIDAANDAGSGIAVMLEIARQLQKTNPDVGVIILMVDAEDYGNSKDEDSYALGTQFWANSLDKTKYIADFGILLDMVGGKDARFLQEYNSLQKAENIVNKVWMQAQVSGTGNYFIMNQTGAITDDHLYINNIAQIPTVDIIDYDQSRPGGFGFYWHTHADNMKIIDKNTLKAVGQTLLDLIFSERGV
jgi:hypothetical protein